MISDSSNALKNRVVYEIKQTGDEGRLDQRRGTELKQKS